MRIDQQLRGLARDLSRWPVASQETARRNAMVASTALTQRRRELDEVEEFLRRHHRASRHRSA
ncbi:hypothetical protein [Nocardioides mesophilus]|uniref:Uncharacterized protein n=1 Tax=Nocardioides mesophilus TaxID=433659 RepID=A0A7G9R8X4_9ACTN|nr:hypothetical protein [Nocardioides mesophilus]QNN52049.1 hypothetical protein H9L09_16265 [Nocardioides mesophilus]